MAEQVVTHSNKKHVIYLGILLGGFATITTSLLVIGNISTSKAIKSRLAEDMRASVSQVIPDSMHDNNLLDNKLKIQLGKHKVVVYQGIKNGRVVAVAYGVNGQGYGGEVKLIMGIRANGEILGVRVLSHHETPGLGDRIEKKKSNWIYSFNGLSLKNPTPEKWKVKKDGGIFDQFSGATITPRAVVKAVKQGLELFGQYRNELLSRKTLVPAKQSLKKVPDFTHTLTGKNNE